MTERDERILNHIGLYRLSLRAVLSKVFFGGKEAACKDVLKRLRDDKLIKSVKGLPDKLKYYQLTRRAALLRGVPENRAVKFGPQAFPEALAVLWFCCMGKRERRRLESDRIEQLLGHSFKNPFAIEKDAQTGESRIYWLYVPPVESNAAYVANRISEHFKLISKLGPSGGSAFGPADMLRARRYVAAVLVERDEQGRKIQDYVYRRKIRDVGPVYFEIVPSPVTLKDRIKEANSHGQGPGGSSSAGDINRQPG
jgi:hypothetical protein